MLFTLILTLTIIAGTGSGGGAAATIHSLPMPDEKTCETAAAKWLAAQSTQRTWNAVPTAVCVPMKPASTAPDKSHHD